MNKPFRCHDAEACSWGFNNCPMPWACGVESPSTRAVPFWKNIMDAFVAPPVTTLDCEHDCPAKSGEYKPAESLHHIQEPRND